jgi:hypothetical protein
VAFKYEKKVQERETEDHHALIVKADVQAFERSKQEKKQNHQKVVQAHRDQLIRQIDGHRELKAAHAMAPQEFAINKRIIDEVEGSSPNGSPKLVKRPF